MSAEKTLALLWGHGFTVSLTDGNGLKVTPSSTLHPDLRDMLKAQKAEIVQLLVASKATTAKLMAAAMRRCDQFNDGDAARQDMRREVLETPPELRQDLLDYFLSKPPT